MRKTLPWIVLFIAVIIIAGCSRPAEPADEALIALVDATAADIQTDVAGTFDKIMASQHPYVNRDNPAFYVFVYDTSVNIVAHPQTDLVGKNYRGKPDAAGTMFRDEIVTGALNNGSGWVQYLYAKPGEEGLKKKATYYQLTTGSDGQQYVVCCGKYSD